MEQMQRCCGERHERATVDEATCDHDAEPEQHHRGRNPGSRCRRNSPGDVEDVDTQAEGDADRSRGSDPDRHADDDDSAPTSFGRQTDGQRHHERCNEEEDRIPVVCRQESCSAGDDDIGRRTAGRPEGDRDDDQAGGDRQEEVGEAERDRQDAGADSEQGAQNGERRQCHRPRGEPSIDHAGDHETDDGDRQAGTDRDGGGIGTHTLIRCHGQVTHQLLAQGGGVVQPLRVVPAVPQGPGRRSAIDGRKGTECGDPPEERSVGDVIPPLHEDTQRTTRRTSREVTKPDRGDDDPADDGQERHRVRRDPPGRFALVEPPGSRNAEEDSQTDAGNVDAREQAGDPAEDRQPTEREHGDQQHPVGDTPERNQQRADHEQRRDGDESIEQPDPTPDTGQRTDGDPDDDRPTIRTAPMLGPVHHAIRGISRDDDGRHVVQDRRH